MKTGIFGLIGFVLACLAVSALVAVFPSDLSADTGKNLLEYLGRSSLKIVTADGLTLYMDPYAGSDYAQPADIIFVTHGHSDHNAIGKVTRKGDTVIVAGPSAVPAGSNVTFVKRGDMLTLKGIVIRAVTAVNGNHPIDKGVGFVISFNGITLYHAGDTSMYPDMASLAKLNITYALLPVDGYYNMGPAEAMKCADLIGAKWYIPFHSSAEGIYGETNVKAFTLPNTIYMKPGETIELKP